MCFLNLFRHLRSLEDLTLNGVSSSSGDSTDVPKKKKAVDGWTSILGIVETI